MKVVQRYPFDNFAKITVVAGSDRVYWQYKSLVYEADRQFLYSEPGLQIHLVKSAEPGIARASYIALLFFIINFGFRSIWGRGELGGRIWVGLLATFFVISVGLFIWQFFKKEFMRISNSGGSPLLWMCSSKDQDMADFILTKIKGTSGTGSVR